MAVQEPGHSRASFETGRRVHGRAAPPAADPAAHERAIAAGLASGDPTALEAAFRSWSGMIHGFCRRAAGAGAADDLTQQVFVEAWRTREGFDPDRGVVPGWLVGPQWRATGLASIEARSTMPWGTGGWTPPTWTCSPIAWW